MPPGRNLSAFLGTRAGWCSPRSVAWIVALGAALFMIQPAISAPSFNCQAASSAVEKLICSSEYISGQDTMLAAIYRRTMELTDDHAGLLMEERAWLKSRSSACALRGKEIPSTDIARFRATTCLYHLYSGRLAALHATFDRLGGKAQDVNPPNKVNDITAENVRSEIVANFQSHLHRFYNTDNVQIDSCDMYLAYYQLDLPGHDSSYGALCRVNVGGQTLSVLMCDDWLVGKWQIAESRSSVDRKNLTQFIGDYCSPGG